MMRTESREPPAAAIKIHERCPTHTLASWDNVFVVIFRTDTTAEGVRALHRECEKFGTATPSGIFLVTVVAQGTPAPAPPERKALATFLGDMSPLVRGSAVIIEGQGFRSAMVRGVVTGLTMLAKQAYPHQVCDVFSAAELFQKVATEREIPFHAERFRKCMGDLRKLVADDGAKSKTRAAQ